MKEPRWIGVRCGTREQWEEHKEKIGELFQIVPATVYADRDGVCLVTSQSWADYLTRKTDERPRSTGKWLDVQPRLDGHVVGECSVCHKVRIVDNFCPNCGSLLDLEE